MRTGRERRLRRKLFIAQQNMRSKLQNTSNLIPPQIKTTVSQKPDLIPKSVVRGPVKYDLMRENVDIEALRKAGYPIER